MPHSVLSPDRSAGTSMHPQVEGIVQFKPGDEIEHSRTPSRVVATGRIVGAVRVDATARHDGAEGSDEVSLPQDVARGLAR